MINLLKEIANVSKKQQPEKKTYYSLRQPVSLQRIEKKNAPGRCSVLMCETTRIFTKDNALMQKRINVIIL